MTDQTKQSKGGTERAKALSADERHQIARKAADARWAKGLPQATHEAELEIGNAKIACAVLDTTKRVLTQETFLTAIGRAAKAKAGTGSRSMVEVVDGLPPFLAANNLKPFISDDLRESTTPILYRTTRGQRAYGYDASLLPKVCEVYLRARDEKVVLPSQSHIVDACDILMRALAHVGIIALVDEATGYQADRARRALAEILEKFISEELRRWVKTFPAAYFKELCRLRGIAFSSDMKLPQYFGKLTNDIVYRRLAPGVLQELQERNPRTESGHRKHKYFQWLTEDIGHPKLLQHLGLVVGVMKLSEDYDDFKEKLDRIAPVRVDLPLFAGLEDDL
jgi:hypothetical protein